MTGPEHYQAAEHCMRQALDFGYGSEECQAKIAEAQVHATLAQAGAMVFGAMMANPNLNNQEKFFDQAAWVRALNGEEGQRTG